MRRMKKQHDYFIIVAVFALIASLGFCLKQDISARNNYGPVVDEIYEVAGNTQFKVDVYRNAIQDLDVYEAAALNFQGKATSETRYTKFPIFHFNIPFSGVQVSAVATGDVVARYDLSKAIINQAGNTLYVKLPEVDLSTLNVEYEHVEQDGFLNDPKAIDYSNAELAARLAMVDEAKYQHIDEIAQVNMERKIRDVVCDLSKNQMTVVFE